MLEREYRPRPDRPLRGRIETPERATESLIGAEDTMRALYSRIGVDPKDIAETINAMDAYKQNLSSRNLDGRRQALMGAVPVIETAARVDPQEIPVFERRYTPIEIPERYVPPKRKS